MLYSELDIAWKECGSGQTRNALERLRNLPTLSDADVACRREWIMGWALFQLGEGEEAFAHAQRAQALAEQLDDAAKARAAALCGWGLSFLGLNDEGFSAASLAVATAERGGDPWSLAFSLYILSSVSWWGGDIAGAIPVAEQALAAAQQLGDTHLQSWILFSLACMGSELAKVARAAGDETAFVQGYEKAITLTSRACDLAQANSDSWAQRIALANNAEFHAYLGHFAQAHRLLDTWNEVGGDIVVRRKIHYLETQAEVLRLEGRLDDACDYAEQALAAAKGDSIVDMIPGVIGILSEIHEARGEFEIALKLYKQFHTLEQQLEGENVKRRARVAAIIYDADKHRQQAQAQRERAEQSEHEASRDPLTGVGNRRMMERTFDAMLIQGRNSVAVIYADLDHFKSVNDRYSHAIGDEVIKAFANVLVSCCRQGDHVARIGGEEFVLLLDENTESSGASSVCERVLNKMRVYPWADIAPGLSMTASLGLARAGEAPGRDAMLALADARMYRAKKNGRDCAVTEGA
jgi:diguanylate cyclase (GGDEF)-like protein